MSLRVGIDVSGAVNTASGIGRYTYELCSALASLVDGPELVGFVNDLRGGSLPDLGFPVRNARWPERLLKGAWGAVQWPPIERFLGPLDVFHSSDWVQPPLARAASVSTVHDLGALLHPEWYAADVVRVHEGKNRDVSERADLIIAISEYTRRTFLEVFSVDPSRVQVVPNGVSSVFRPAAAGVVPGLLHLSLPGPYVLYVGTRERRKNLPGLLEIFSLVAAEDPGMSLVLVGARPWEEARGVHGAQAWTGRELEDEIAQRGLTARVRILGRVSGEELRVLYSGAECFAFPSLFEGFGLPVLEAMACGCPVVGSNRSAVPEVVGDAGLVVDPEDGPAFAKAVLNVSSDSGLRRRLATAGHARAASFTWRRTASMTWDVYRDAAARCGAPAARRVGNELLRYGRPTVGLRDLSPAKRKTQAESGIVLDGVQRASEGIGAVWLNQKCRLSIDDHLRNPADAGGNDREAPCECLEDDQRVVLGPGRDNEGVCPSHPRKDAGGGVGSCEAHATGEAEPKDLLLQLAALPAITDDGERPASSSPRESLQQNVDAFLKVQATHEEEAITSRTGVLLCEPRVTDSVVEDLDIGPACDVSPVDQGRGAELRCRQHKIRSAHETSFQVESLKRTEPAQHADGSPWSQRFGEIGWVIVMTRRDAEDVGRHTAKGLGRLGCRSEEDVWSPFTYDLGDQSAHTDDVPEQSGAFGRGPGRVGYVWRPSPRREERAARVVTNSPQGLDEGAVYPLAPSGARVIWGEVLYEKETHGPGR